MIKIPIKSHITNRTPQPITIKNKTIINRYSKPIPSFSYMVRVLSKNV